MARKPAYTTDDASGDSLLKKVGRVGMSGLEAAGNVLGTPGAMVRNALGGKNPLTPLLHPISGEGRISGRDLLRQSGLIGRRDNWANFASGLALEIGTDPLTYVGGIGALSKAGKLAKVSGGLGEVGATLGRAGLGGQAITKASELAPHVPELAKALQAGSVADEPLRYAFRVGLPFTEGVGVPAPKLFKGLDLLGDYATKPSRLAPALEKVAQGVGLAQKSTPAQNVSVRFARPLGEKVASAADFLPREASMLAEHKGVAPWAKGAADVLTLPGRAAKMLFHGPTRGKLSEEAQALAGAASKHAEHLRAGYVRQAAEKIAPFEALETEFSKSYERELGQMLKTNPAATPRALFERLVSLASETPKGTAHALGEMILPHNAGFAQKLDSFVDDTRKLMDSMHAEAIRAGLPTGWLSDIAATADTPGFRYMTRAALERTGGYSLSAGRQGAIRHVPAVIGDLIANRVHELEVGGMKRAQLAKVVENEFGEYLNQASTMNAAGQTVPQFTDKLTHAEHLVDWALGHGKPGQTFRHDFMQNLHDYVLDHVHKLGNAWALHDLLASNLLQRPLQQAVKAGALPKDVEQLRGLLDTASGNLHQSGTPFVPLKSVFQSLADEGIGELSKPGLGKLDPVNAAKYLAEKMGAPAGQADQWAQTIMEHGALPQAVAKAIQGGMDAGRLITHEPTLQLLHGAIDPFTKWLKTHFTVPFLGFLTRNKYSGTYANLASGEISTPLEAAAYLGKEKEYMSRFLKGGFSRAEEAEWLANGVLDPRFTGALGLEMETPRFGHVAPGSIDPRVAFKEAGEQIKNAKVLKGPRKFMQAWINTGAAGNRLVEFLNRVPMYEYLKSKGWSPVEAAKRVAELQIDYSSHNFSPFENEILTRLLPFYRWHRKMAPLMIQRLLQEPRGLLGQTSRLAGAMHQNDPTTPEWISGTLSVPFPAGVKEPGGKAFITGLGLPQESALGYFGGGIRGALRQLGSQLHPIPKTAIETATGQSLFQEGPGGTGRPLEELTPTLGQTAANLLSVTGRNPQNPVKFPSLLEQGIGLTPLTRYLTTARQLTDTRKTLGAKALNLATGIRVANVSPTQQESALRRRADELLSSLGARRFTESYVPKDRLEGMSPTRRALVENLLDLKKDIDKQRKARAKKR